MDTPVKTGLRRLQNSFLAAIDAPCQHQESEAILEERDDVNMRICQLCGTKYQAFDLQQ